MKTIRHRLSSIIEYGRCALKRDEEKRVRFSARIPLYLIGINHVYVFRSIQPENIVI
ncbi:hypothetical protein [Sinorhizobium medicae]|nr:hypothetical protein [Sinorhizobium medicae]